MIRLDGYSARCHRRFIEPVAAMPPRPMSSHRGSRPVYFTSADRRCLDARAFRSQHQLFEMGGLGKLTPAVLRVQAPNDEAAIKTSADRRPNLTPWRYNRRAIVPRGVLQCRRYCVVCPVADSMASGTMGLYGRHRIVARCCRTDKPSVDPARPSGPRGSAPRRPAPAGASGLERVLSGCLPALLADVLHFALLAEEEPDRQWGRWRR